MRHSKDHYSPEYCNSDPDLEGFLNPKAWKKAKQLRGVKGNRLAVIINPTQVKGHWADFWKESDSVREKNEREDLCNWLRQHPENWGEPDNTPQGSMSASITPAEVAAARRQLPCGKAPGC